MCMKHEILDDHAPLLNACCLVASAAILVIKYVPGSYYVLPGTINTAVSVFYQVQNCRLL